eukprot:15337279-Ditylum_brightwellii.AAC.1
MGIKGIYSLLQEDPNRFGSSFVASSSSSSSSSSNVILYIDGPALHHHILSSFKGDTATGIICGLSKLYHATQEFAHLLHASTQAKEIHVIMDGVSSPWKRDCQVSRMEERARVCSSVATSLTQCLEKKKEEIVADYLW